jgi:hypothetical protein
MRPRPRRPGWVRLLLISAALASLVGGYYLGQYWQRQPLDALSAVVYPDGQRVGFPAAAGILAGTSDDDPWRILIVTDLQTAACQELLRHFALVRNRLAGWPDIQRRIRLTLLDFGHVSPGVLEPLIAEDWMERPTLDQVQLAELTASLGIQPAAGALCTATQANAVLVAPDLRRWALLPYEQPAIMAHNIATIVQFVE